MKTETNIAIFSENEFALPDKCNRYRVKSSKNQWEREEIGLGAASLESGRILSSWISRLIWRNIL